MFFRHSPYPVILSDFCAKGASRGRKIKRQTDFHVVNFRFDEQPLKKIWK
jgi:hypothetical protein